MNKRKKCSQNNIKPPLAVTKKLHFSSLFKLTNCKDQIGPAEDKLLQIRFWLPSELHLMLRYQRDITTISRCPLRRWLQLRQTTAGDQLFMCACIPLVWRTQPQAGSQGCCIRTSDLHFACWRETWKWKRQSM